MFLSHLFFNVICGKYHTITTFSGNITPGFILPYSPHKKLNIYILLNNLSVKRPIHVPYVHLYIQFQ